LVFINLYCIFLLRNQTHFSKAELKLFQKIMHTALTKYPNFSVPMNECCNIPLELEIKGLSVSQADEFVQKMIRLQYLAKYYKHEPKVRNVSLREEICRRESNRAKGW
jgi:hypothetical protein